MTDERENYSTGEIYRAVLKVEARLEVFQQDFKSENHSLRNKLGLHETAIALTAHDIADLKRRAAANNGARQTVAIGIFVAIVTGFVEYLLHGILSK